MRLSPSDHKILLETFEAIFPPDDHLWLFGSRADDTRRGGDIDLFIESSASEEELSEMKGKFFWELQKKLGEQKIDIVTHRFGAPSLKIHEEARTTGIRLK